MILQMRAINGEQLQVHSARQARELERTQLDLHAARKASLDSSRSVVAQDSTGDPKQLDRVVLQLAKSEELCQQLKTEKSELERELDRMRSGQIVVDARKKLNVLHNKSAAQEANVSRAQRALDECNGNLAQHATASRTGTIVSTRPRKQEQQQLDHCRKLISSL